MSNNVVINTVFCLLPLGTLFINPSVTLADDNLQPSAATSALSSNVSLTFEFPRLDPKPLCIRPTPSSISFYNATNINLDSGTQAYSTIGEYGGVTHGYDFAKNGCGDANAIETYEYYLKQKGSAVATALPEAQALTIRKDFLNFNVSSSYLSGVYKTFFLEGVFNLKAFAINNASSSAASKAVVTATYSNGEKVAKNIISLSVQNNDEKDYSTPSPIPFSIYFPPATVEDSRIIPSNTLLTLTLYSAVKAVADDNLDNGDIGGTGIDANKAIPEPTTAGGVIIGIVYGILMKHNKLKKKKSFHSKYI